jgi:hypothetical protein
MRYKKYWGSISAILSLSLLVFVLIIEKRNMIIDENQQWKLGYLTQEELDLLAMIKTRHYR